MLRLLQCIGLQMNAQGIILISNLTVSLPYIHMHTPPYFMNKYIKMFVLSKTNYFLLQTNSISSPYKLVLTLKPRRTTQNVYRKENSTVSRTFHMN